MTYQLRILGCGSSGGVPRITGDWGVCDPNEPKNRRTRCSALVTYKATRVVDNIVDAASVLRILVDCSPDMREQLLKARVNELDAVLLTHDHADQTHGIDDLRAIVYERRERLNVHMDKATAKTMDQRFGYCFEAPEGSGYPPILEKHLVSASQTEIKFRKGPIALSVIPFRQIHGPIESVGYRFGGLAYSSDISDLPEESKERLQGLSCWVIDALRMTPHPTHLHLEKALNLIEELRPQRAVLTNLHIDMDYEALKTALPPHVVPAYDGMLIDDH